MAKKKAGRGFFGMLTSGKKEVYFSARGDAKNVQAWSSKEKKVEKG